MDAPLITIGLTTYNAEDTVRKALDSIFHQTWHPFEVVAVDDCSQDGTWRLLVEYADLHTEMRIFKNEQNGGQSIGYNRIITEAQGEFVAFFDDDDESLPERIAEQYRRIIDYERDFARGMPVVCHTARKVIYPDGEIRIESTMGQYEGIPAPSGNAVSRHILLGTPLDNGDGGCPTCCMMARLRTFRSLGGYDSSFRRWMDTDFIIVLAEAGSHFVGIGKPLVIQTMTKSSDKSLEIEYQNKLLMFQKHRHIMESAGQYTFCLRWIALKRVWQKKQSVFFLLLMFLFIRHPVLTYLRLIRSLPGLGRNRAFRRFHG